MGLETGKEYHGFQLVRAEDIIEINSRALMFEHQKSGAELLILENSDDNKTFSATFRTPPSNNRGVAHILEHSVLCGSRKFPVKEPFVELIKGSLQTFLNAMTFSDKTMYPVASRNEKDFYNLMDVYLDAVFHPRINEDIFMQEGWHYELNTVNDDIIYKGVVYNEMKGVFSSPENLLDRHLAHALFPDTTYGYESGGDPEEIPDLTYEEFKGFHQKFYHPSNSRLFIYGDGDTLNYLKFLDSEYLSEFSRSSINSSIEYQKRFKKPKRKKLYYPISKEESLENKTYVAVAMKLDKTTDQEHCLAFHILSHLLLGTAASPLRKALIDSGLGSEVIGGGFDDYRLETMFAVGLKGTRPENESRVVDLIFSTLRNLAQNGIDEDMIRSAVNSVEFKLRESNYGGFPKGIVYNIQALSSWLYDAEPLMHLRYEESLARIKEGAHKGYFEKLIRKYLLQNKHQVIMVANPNPGLGKKLDSLLKKKLKKVKSTLPLDEQKKLVEENKRLQEQQLTPDSPEALASLPQLSLEDISRKSQSFPVEVKNESSPTILFHDLFTNKIAYTQIGFNTQSVPQDKIQYLPLLGKLVLGMGTKKRSYVEMSQRIGIHTGGIRMRHFTSVGINDRNRLISYLFFNGKSVIDKMPELFDIFQELFHDQKFSNTRRMVEIIRSAKSDMEDSIIPNGNQYVLSRLQSYHSSLGRYDELTDGIAYYKFLEGLLERAESHPEEVAETFSEVAGYIFNRDNVLMNFTSEAEDFPAFENHAGSLMDGLSDSPQTPVSLEFEGMSPNEAFLTSSQVQYVGKGVNLYDLGYEYNGHFDVLKSVLGTGYLWERVRVQGGAYGCSSSFDRYSGDFGLVSYRDPNLMQTFNAYDEIPEFIASLDLTQDQLTKFIIGSVGHLDPPLTPDRKGSIAMVEYLTGITLEMKQKRRDQLLSTRLEDLKGYAPLFEKIKESGTVCVVGNEDTIRKSSNEFDHLVKIFT